MPLKMIHPDSGHHLEFVDSTNLWIRNPAIPLGSWVSAEEQTHGKGRGNHSWFGFGEEKIIFSAKIGLPFDEISFPLVSLLVGGAILKTVLLHFPELKNELRIKWPNDLYRGSKKVGGVLIETSGNGKEFEVIIGIGLNLYSSQIPAEIQDIADVIFSHPPLEGTKERLLASLVEQINKSLLSSFSSDTLWKEIDFIESFSVLRDAVVETTHDNQTIRGKVMGIAQNGFLVLVLSDGRKVELMDTSPDFRILS